MSKTVSTLVASALLLSLAAGQALASNLVIFVADDLGWGDVGYHGSEIRTPVIDELAADGVRLNRFYVNPLCSPTRSALMTGRNSLRTGVLIPFEPWFEKGPALDEKFLPEYLRDVGYQTYAVGKWHLGPNKRAYYPTSRGFEHFYGSLGGFLNYETHTYWRAVDWQRNGETIIEEGYATHLVANEAVRLIENRDPDRPMFLFVSFHAPHSPLQAPEEAIAEYSAIEDNARRVFAAMVTEMDRALGRVLDALDAAGIRDETLVLFMSDNGGNPRLGASNGDLRGGKLHAFEGGIRVPAILSWPEHLPAGRIHNEIVSVEDLLPTLARGLEIQPEYAKPLDGVDLWQSIASGAPTDSRMRILARHDRVDYSMAVLEDEWKLVRFRQPEQPGVTTHLFRIADDPYEQLDLAAEHPEVLERLSTYFEDFPKADIVGLDDAPIPTRTDPGGPAAIEADWRDPINPPYTETAGGQ